MFRIDRMKAAGMFDGAAFISLCLMIFFTGFSNSGVEVCFVAALVAAAAKEILGGRPREILPRTPVDIPLLVFVIAGFASLTYSIYPFKSLRAVLSKILEYALIMLLMIKSVNTRKRFNIMIGVVLFTACLLGASGVYQRITGFDFIRHRPLNFAERSGVPRLTSAFIKRTGFGAYLTLVLPLSVVLALSAKLRPHVKTGMGVLAALLSYCIVFTYARGAWLGSMIAFSIFFLYIVFKYLRSVRRLTALLLLVLICLTVFPLLPVSVQERLISIEHVDKERLNIWQAVTEMIKDRPFFGHGAGRFMDVYPSYRIAGKYRIYAHNSYLQIAAETGLVGLFSFLSMIAALWVSGMRSIMGNRKYDPYLLGLLCGLIAFLVHSFFDNLLFSLQLAALFWAMAGLTASAIKLDNDGTYEGGVR